MSEEKTILIVDDDPDFVAIHREVLEAGGYTVLTACNGRQCLQTAASERPDLIILDVMMDTQTEGFNVTYGLRNGEETKDIPILMVTSIYEKHPYTSEPEQFWSLVDAFLEKPVEPQKLLEWARKMTSKQTPAER